MSFINHDKSVLRDPVRIWAARDVRSASLDHRDAVRVDASRFELRRGKEIFIGRGEPRRLADLPPFHKFDGTEHRPVHMIARQRLDIIHQAGIPANNRNVFANASPLERQISVNGATLADGGLNQTRNDHIGLPRTGKPTDKLDARLRRRLQPRFFRTSKEQPHTSEPRLSSL